LNGTVGAQGGSFITLDDGLDWLIEWLPKNDGDGV
jgi:hypothetical protein